MGGTVHFEQASEQAPTVITYKIQGNDSSAERGMHIHQFGDNTNGCTSAGPHCMFSSPFLLIIIYIYIYIIKQGKRENPKIKNKIKKRLTRRGKGEGDKSSDDDTPPKPPTLPQLVNPFSKTHGAPNDEERHVGDLGNFKTDSNGNAEGTITDTKVKLIGPTSVLGVCEPPPPPKPCSLPFLSLSLSEKKEKKGKKKAC